MSRSQQTPFEYSFETRGDVLVLDLTDWSGGTEAMDEAEADWLSKAGRAHITATVTEFSPETTLGRETQDHLARAWSENAREANVEKLAFVSEGIKARAVSANLDVPQEIKTFKSVEEAVEWARE
ncbi:hypothetical protein GRX03_04005 [Halovenus sp. WSH3]|uniref:STAS/SEC14 domain-containing protein n=1 Tax=Halovenus carboxidivorans TaxID=2692199 RepID=A0A6B0T7A0_9EURY|nr:hypothetical protein [Halovenus carboxidivorans]MXR50770.1 hypothetical protein [Halovenus carboxidivorans]